MKKLLFSLLIAISTIFIFTKCEEKTTGEKIEDTLEDVSEELEDGAKDVGEDLKEDIDNMKDKIKEETN